MDGLILLIIYSMSSKNIAYLFSFALYRIECSENGKNLVRITEISYSLLFECLFQCNCFIDMWSGFHFHRKVLESKEEISAQMSSKWRVWRAQVCSCQCKNVGCKPVWRRKIKARWKLFNFRASSCTMSRKAIHLSLWCFLFMDSLSFGKRFLRN